MTDETQRIALAVEHIAAALMKFEPWAKHGCGNDMDLERIIGHGRAARDALAGVIRPPAPQLSVGEAEVPDGASTIAGFALAQRDAEAAKRNALLRKALKAT
jgi:hypothetical protein